MAAFWDIVGKAANLFQLFGVDAVTLIAIAASFLQFHEMNKECRKLEERVRMLRLLLHSPGGYWVMQRQQEEVQLGELLQVTNALREAQDLVEAYKGSSLYAIVVRGLGSSGMAMATRFLDLRSRVDFCCDLILAVNAVLLVVEVQPTNQLNHPPPDPSLVVRTEGNDDDDVGVPPSAGDSVHVAAEPPSSSSSTTAPDDTHVIDISLIQPTTND